MLPQYCTIPHYNQQRVFLSNILTYSGIQQLQRKSLPWSVTTLNNDSGYTLGKIPRLGGEHSREEKLRGLLLYTFTKSMRKKIKKEINSPKKIVCWCFFSFCSPSTIHHRRWPLSINRSTVWSERKCRHIVTLR